MLSARSRDAGGHGRRRRPRPRREHSAHVDTVVAPKAYDPTKPIDLGGVEGVTPEQQARAENLIAVTLADLRREGRRRLRQPASSRSATASPGPSTLSIRRTDDGHLLDPDYPESLVYDTSGPEPQRSRRCSCSGQGHAGRRARRGRQADAWHIHNNLWLHRRRQVHGITNADGSCNPPLKRACRHLASCVDPFARVRAVRARRGRRCRPDQGRRTSSAPAHGGHANRLASIN
jgi:hypothetical protein